MEILKSQTGTGVSKRILAAVSAVLALVVVLMSSMGHSAGAQAVTDQTANVTVGLDKVVEGVSILASAVLAIWSKWQDGR